jgi:hypothetical protein
MISFVTLAILSIHPNECWKSIPGGFKGNEVYNAAIDKFAQQDCVFVEIGSLMGQSTCYMANSLKLRNISHVQFDVIDYWASLHTPSCFEWRTAPPVDTSAVIESKKVSSLPVQRACYTLLCTELRSALRCILCNRCRIRNSGYQT